jgi:hypothetical protein
LFLLVSRKISLISLHFFSLSISVSGDSYRILEVAVEVVEVLPVFAATAQYTISVDVA